MHLITFTLILSCLFFCSLSAQTYLGLRVLSGSSDLTSPAAALPASIGEHDRVATTTFGLVLERALSDHLYLRSGLQMSQRGTTLQRGNVPKILGAPVPLDYETQIRMNYVDFPLALRVAFPVAPQVELTGWGGATAGYAVGGSIRSRSTTSQNFQLTTQQLDMANYAFPRFHLGYLAGAGMALKLGETAQFRLEAEYNHSTQEKAMISQESGKHGYANLHFGAGLVFRL